MELVLVAFMSVYKSSFERDAISSALDNDCTTWRRFLLFGVIARESNDARCWPGAVPLVRLFMAADVALVRMRPPVFFGVVALRIRGSLRNYYGRGRKFV